MMMFEQCMYSNVDIFFFFKQKTAYEVRISDWSSDVCSSDLIFRTALYRRFQRFQIKHYIKHSLGAYFRVDGLPVVGVVGFVYRSNEIGRASCRERVCQYV